MKKTRENILAVTSFPPRGKTHADQVVGIASYAKSTFRALGKAIDTKKRLSFEILAEKLPGETDYKKGNIHVKRVWERNSFGAFMNLGREIFKNYKNTKTVVIEFELSMFGGIIYLLFFPLFLGFLKLLDKKIIFVCHQVIPDMRELAPHINLANESFKTDIMSFMLKIFYRYVLLLSSKVIVFEEGFRNRLSKFGNPQKIVVIPHGVEKFKNVPDKIKARKKLGIPASAFVILSFGFIAWYKGTDWLVHTIEELKEKQGLKARDLQLILAGGPNPNHEDKEYYQKYFKGITKECRREGFTLTGFVPENLIPTYFKAADLIVLPYRTFMSSSGPLSITFSFDKPFLLSPKLGALLDSKDLKALLSRLKIKENELVFQNSNGDFAKKVNKLRRSSGLRTKLARFSREARKMRSWDIIGRKYYEAIVN